MNYLNLLSEQFNHRIAVKEKRPNIHQLLAPFYHEDGDMIEIYLQQLNDNLIRVCDYGMTIMRLSYSYDLNTEKKMEIFTQILSENQVNEDNGNLYIDTKPEHLYSTITQLAQTISKVSNMRLYKREMIKSLFYEMVDQFVSTELTQFKPQQKVIPIPSRPELEVDYSFENKTRPIYLFAVKDDNKAKIVTISCLEFLRAELPFKSAVVYEDFESLPRKDKRFILSATDKQFPDYDDFTQHAFQFLQREIIH